MLPNYSGRIKHQLIISSKEHTSVRHSLIICMNIVVQARQQESGRSISGILSAPMVGHWCHKLVNCFTRKVKCFTRKVKCFVLRVKHLTLRVKHLTLRVKHMTLRVKQ